MKPRTGSIIRPTRFNLVALIAFAAPVGAVLLAPMVLQQPEPLIAKVAVDPAAAPGATLAPRPARPEVAAAMARSNEIASALMDTTPLYYPPRVVEVVEAPAPEPVAAPVEAPKPKVIEPPTASVSSIIRTADGKGIAVINGKLHRVGDSIAGGWKIIAIDPKARIVTLDHAETQPVTLTLVDPRHE